MKEEWSGRLGFILASIGSAIGIGNIWRFPYIMGETGGGTFVFAYLVSVLALGIPLMLLEFSIGKKFKLSLFNTFKKINPNLRFLALIPILTVFFIATYYLVITGWTLSYFIDSIFGEYQSFETFSSGYKPAVFTIISLAVCIGIISFGVRKGIEFSSKILIPLLGLILLFIFFQALQFPKSLEGIAFYFTPDFSKLADSKIWSLAFAQALFSLSAGYGILLTYGSYLRKNVNVFTSSVIVAVADTLVALVAAAIIFATIYSFNLPLVEGSTLSFVILPEVFESIKLGFLLGSLFFLLLFIAAITSAISMVEVVTKNLKDYFNFGRLKSTLIVFVLILLFSIPISFSYSSLFKINLLETMDNIFGNIFTLISAIIICLFVSWKWKLSELVKEIGLHHLIPIDRKLGKATSDILARSIQLSVRYLIPLVLLILLVFELFN